MVGSLDFFVFFDFRDPRDPRRLFDFFGSDKSGKFSSSSGKGFNSNRDFELTESENIDESNGSKNIVELNGSESVEMFELAGFEVVELTVFGETF